MMGLISAFSKAGAAIGTQVFTSVLNSYADDPAKGNQVTFLIGSGLAALGSCLAFFLVPDANRILGDEDSAWKIYLMDRGWEGATWGDQETKDPEGVLKRPVQPTS
jgi:hypothetical protein